MIRDWAARERDRKELAMMRARARKKSAGIGLLRMGGPVGVMVDYPISQPLTGFWRDAPASLPWVGTQTQSTGGGTGGSGDSVGSNFVSGTSYGQNTLNGHGYANLSGSSAAQVVSADNAVHFVGGGINYSGWVLVNTTTTVGNSTIFGFGGNGTPNTAPFTLELAGALWFMRVQGNTVGVTAIANTWTLVCWSVASSGLVQTMQARTSNPTFNQNSGTGSTLSFTNTKLYLGVVPNSFAVAALNGFIAEMGWIAGAVWGMTAEFELVRQYVNRRYALSIV